jgi:hypothetical protein
VVIVRQLAQYRFLRSTHIAALVGRSIDRTNDRLARLFHAGYVDRPHAQLDYYPTSGSAPMIYALAARGARLLIERCGIDFANVNWTRKSGRAGRPFIEHQLEIVDFQISLQHERSTPQRPEGAYLTALPATRPTEDQGPKSLLAGVPQEGITVTVHSIVVLPRPFPEILSFSD